MANELERLRAIGLDPNFSDPQVYGPARPTGQSGQLSTLDMLRKRMASELESEQSQRMSDLGNALLASRNRSLFGALGEGFRAQDEGARARMDRLRQLAETERQERALESQEAARRDQATYQQGSLALRRLEAERAGRPQFQVVGVDRATGYAVAVDPRDPTQTPRILQGVTPTQAARFSAQAENTLRTAAGREARSLLDREIQDRTQRGERALSDADRRARLAELEQERLAAFGLTPMPGTATAEPPAGQSGRPVMRENFVPPEQRR